MTPQAHIAILEVEVATLRQQNKALIEEVNALKQKVILLLKQAQSPPRKDSHNSHNPPSQDKPKPRRTRSLRQKSGRKSGGQPGHDGHTLKMSLRPDQVHRLKPSYCTRCGFDLAGVSGALVSCRQVVELPPVRPIYEEYRQYRCCCPGCGHGQVADYPSGVVAPIQYGSSVVAHVGYWHAYQYLPYRRMKEMFRHLFGLPLSEGSISNLIQRASTRLSWLYNQIHQRLEGADYVGSDETSFKQNGQRDWIWVWQNAALTYLAASEDRGSDTINRVFPDGFVQATLGSDRLAAQLKTKAASHQVCLAHLLRDLIWLEESESHAWSRHFKDLLTQALALRRVAEARGYAFREDERCVWELEHRLNRLLTRFIDKVCYKETACFQRSMIRHRGNLFGFLYDLSVPPDNNGSERALRNVKVKQKVSGQFKTGQYAFCVLRSVIDTLIKRDLEVFPYLSKCIATQTT